MAFVAVLGAGLAAESEDVSAEGGQATKVVDIEALSAASLLAMGVAPDSKDSAVCLADVVPAAVTAKEGAPEGAGATEETAAATLGSSGPCEASCGSGDAERVGGGGGWDGCGMERSTLRTR